MNLKRLMKDFIIGLFMGTANIIPGVSGGTVALIMGIYDKLIEAINDIPKDLPLALIKLDFSAVKARVKRIDYLFLGALFFGALTAVVSIARGLSFLINHHPAPTYALFTGLIAGSVIIIYKYIDELNVWSVLSAVLGILFIFLVLSIPNLSNIHHPGMVFLAGMFSIASMILPGISGSYLLIILNQYEYMLEALYSFNVFVITIFMAGALVGLFGLAKILNYLLKKARSVTIAFLFGLMLGALREPLGKSMGSATTPLEVVLPTVTGAVVVVFLEYRYLSKVKE
ncbi:MAG: DUF368 domain-containing protein [Candidatus Natronoplasma sp.]